MRRRLAIAAAALAVLAISFAVYRLAFVGSGPGRGAATLQATSVIGSGSSAVGVAADGTILLRRPLPKHAALPSLPIDRPPKGGRLRGPLLEQARVLGAAPAVLRPCVEASGYGESGVDVMLASGIELRFGTAARATRKWAAAAAILADPTVTEIGYVDLHSPGHASIGGSGVTLPAAAAGGPATCGKRG